MSKTLKGKKIAIIATDGFERSELLEPKKALEESGAKTVVLSPESGRIKGWEKGNWWSEIDVDDSLEDAHASDFDGLLIPGGTLNCDSLRTDENAVGFVREFFEQKKPVASICHGPQLLIEADVLSGRKVTSFHAIRTDVENAGADWKDEEVVCDQGLVTSRTPDDLPAFVSKMIEEFAEGKHDRQRP